MGDILNTGLVLLVLGMTVVFLVLLFLMFVMQTMSKIVNTGLRRKTNLLGGDIDEEELVVVMSVLNAVNPGLETANIRLKLIQ